VHNGKCLATYALLDRRCSQQLHAIVNPSDEEVALPNSSITTKLLHNLTNLTPQKPWKMSKKFLHANHLKCLKNAVIVTFFVAPAVQNTIDRISKGHSSKDTS
jgi:hypothetical protein